MAGFDPYLIWLDIPPHERPVSFYRLLGLRPLESDPQTIAAAADRAIRHVAQFRNSPQAAECAQLLAELNAALACLVDPVRKQAYDRGIGMAAGGERSITSPGLPAQQVRSPPAPLSGGYVPGAASHAAQPQTILPHGGLPPGGHAPSSAAPQGSAPAAAPVMPAGSFTPGIGAAQPGHGGVAPVAARWTAPAPSAPHAVQPSPQGPAAAPQAHPAGPSGTAPAGAELMERPLAYQPPTQSATSAPAAPVQMPAAAAPPTLVYPQAPVHPAPPPAWASGDRTGQVTTWVAGPAAAQEVSAERTQHRRIVRRQIQTSAAYMVVAFAIAMMVFFFGAVVLLAIYFSNR